MMAATTPIHPRRPAPQNPSDEPTITDRLAEQPSFSFERVRKVKPRDLGIRFLAGALTSVAAGVLTLAGGPRLGGIMLAFPAILAASLTLIEQEEDAVDAREDSRGAMIGAPALAAFAAVAAAAFTRWTPGLVLLAAGAAWALVALGGYLICWYRRS